MPNFNEKFKKHKTVKTPSGKSSRHILKKKPGKHVCAISKKPLQGMPHGKRPFEVARLTKTQRRPENLLASMISPDVRKDIYLQAVMLKYNVITLDDVDLRYLKYIEMIKNKIE
jgi:ribosomal protein L34E